MTGRDDRQARGGWAESLACLLLRLKGYRILERRRRGGRGTGLGELDIVIRRGRALAAVEVKARPTRDAALHAVTPGQRRRIERALVAYQARRTECAQCDLRFDIVTVGAWPWFWPRHFPQAWRWGE